MKYCSPPVFAPKAGVSEPQTPGLTVHHSVDRNYGATTNTVRSKAGAEELHNLLLRLSDGYPAHVAIRQNIKNVFREHHDGPRTQRSDVIEPRHLQSSSIVHPNGERRKGFPLDQSFKLVAHAVFPRK